MFRCPGRVLRDYSEVATNDTGFIHLIPSDNMKQFCVQIDGPECTPYATGKYMVQVTIPPDYPMDPPKISMMTKIWHPNISHAGKICVDILDVGDAWLPGMALLEVLEGLRGLLALPNPASPLNVEAGVMMRTDRESFNSVAVGYTCTFAHGTISDPDIEGNLSILTAMGLTREVALVKLAMCKNNIQRVIDLYVDQ